MVLGLKEGTAIISVNTDNGLKAECFVLVNATEGVQAITTDDANAPIFTLSGQRLEKPRKGVNIVGGRKVVVK